MNSKELKQIAIDLFDGKIFCDQQLNSSRDLSMVFLPLILGALKGFGKEELEDIGMIYEYIGKAMPRSINGYPIFSSMRILKKQDLKIMMEHFEAYKKLKEQFQQEEK